MIVSRESDYAIRILRALADGEKHKVSQVCESELVPNKFGYKIINKLRDAGFIHCEQGRYGGCTLACDLHEVSVYDVLAAIDHECYMNECLKPGHVCQWKEEHDKCCCVHQKLGGLQDRLVNILKDMDLYSVMFE